MTWSVSIFRDATHRWPTPRSADWRGLGTMLAKAPVARPDIPAQVEVTCEAIDQLYLDFHDGQAIEGREPWGPPFARLFAGATARGLPRPLAAEAARLELHERAAREAKARLPAWSPAAYPPGRARGKKNVIAVSCLVLDYDEGMSIAEAAYLWRDWPFFLHTSWSYTLTGEEKFRVVLPLAAPVPAAEWDRVWLFVRDIDGDRHDRKCHDASRIYFRPAIQGPGRPWMVIVNPGRRLLDLSPENLPPRPPPPPRPTWTPPKRWGSLSAERAALEQRWTLRRDPDARRRAGEAVGGRISGTGRGERVEDVLCPACGKKSVWWPVTPEKKTRASCHHRKTCGFDGDLYDLLMLMTGAGL